MGDTNLLPSPFNIFLMYIEYLLYKIPTWERYNKSNLWSNKNNSIRLGFEKNLLE